MYLRLANSYLSHDREPELSVIDLSVQLFTVPSLSSYLTSQTPILSTLFYLLKAFFLTDIPSPHFSLETFFSSFRAAQKISRYPKLTCDGEAIKSSRYWHIFNDLKYLISAARICSSGGNASLNNDNTASSTEDGNFSFRFGRAVTLAQVTDSRALKDYKNFLDLVFIWQEMNPQKRQVRQHIEYESESWVHAFNLTLQVSRLIKGMAACFMPLFQKPTAAGATHTAPATAADEAFQDLKTIMVAMKHVIKVLDAWCTLEQKDENTVRLIGGEKLVSQLYTLVTYLPPSNLQFAGENTMKVIKFKVSRQPVSFHHPLHWFFAHLISYIPRIVENSVGKVSNLKTGGDIWRLLLILKGGAGTGMSASSMPAFSSFSASSMPASSFGGLGLSVTGHPTSAVNQQHNHHQQNDMEVDNGMAATSSTNSNSFAGNLPPPGGRSAFSSDSSAGSDINNRIPYMETTEEEDRILKWVDFPLRVCSLLAQIKAGVWVRNGFNIRSQAIHYRELTLKECYDLDVLTVQCSFALVGHDRLLVNMMERFELVEWFNGVTHPATIPAQLTNSPALTSDPYEMSVIAEDFLQLLITIITERTRIAGAGIEEQMRREIIHHLATNPNGLAYSELTKRVPDYLVDNLDDPEYGLHRSSKSFDEVLSDLTSFKFPEGAADRGLYELKPEYFKEVDPWFWHYTRNQREDINEVLRKRKKEAMAKDPSSSTKPFWDTENASSPSSITDQVLIPQMVFLPPSSEFGCLSKVVDSPVFIRMLFFSLWNVTRREGEESLPVAPDNNSPTAPTDTTVKPVMNDTVLSCALHLILVALVLEKQYESCHAAITSSTSYPVAFIHRASQMVHTAHSLPIYTPTFTPRKEGYTLLQLLFQLLERSEEDELKEYASTLRYIVNQFEKSSVSASLVQQWKRPFLPSQQDIAAGGAVHEIGEAEMSEFDKKKAAAKARKKNLMAEFAAAQQSFMDTFGDELDELDEANKAGGDEDISTAASDEAFEMAHEDLDCTLPEQRVWAFPNGTCIVCQEESNKDSDFYGMLGYIQPSCVQKHADLSDANTLSKLLDSSLSSSLTLDLDILPETDNQPSLDTNRPTTAAPFTIDNDTAIGLDPFFPAAAVHSEQRGSSTYGLYSSTCGHLMHFKCFKSYTTSVENRHSSQPTRNHPEDVDRKEFMCPLCKSLGNCLLPILWGDKTEHCNWNGSTSSLKVRQISDSSKSFVLVSDRLQEWLDQTVSGFFVGVKPQTVEGLSSSVRAGDTSSVNGDDDNNMKMDDDGGNSENIKKTSLFELGAISRGFQDAVSKFVSGILSRGGSTSGDPSSSSSNATFSAPLSMIKDPNLEEVISFNSKLVATVKMVFRRVNSDYEVEDVGLNALDLLWSAYSYTISSLEIMNRGTSGYTGGAGSVTSRMAFEKANSQGFVYLGLLGALSQQSILLLRVLSETILTYTSIMIQNQKQERMLNNRNIDLLRTIFFGIVETNIMEVVKKGSEEDIQRLFNLHEIDDIDMLPVLMDEPFNLLTECCLSVIPCDQSFNVTDVFKWMELFWIMDIFKVVASVVESVVVFGEDWASSNGKFKEGLAITMASDESVPDLSPFLLMVMHVFGVESGVRSRFIALIDHSVVYSLIHFFTLPYLRRCTLLLHSRFGLVPPHGENGFGYDKATSVTASLSEMNTATANGMEESRSVTTSAPKDEMSRLLAYLGLPTISQVCTSSVLFDETSQLSVITKGWLTQLVLYDPAQFSGRKMSGSSDVVSSVTRSSPARSLTSPSSARSTLSPSQHISASLLSPTTTTTSMMNDSVKIKLITLESPSIMHLITVPSRIDSLVEEALRHVCQKCGSNPTEPALCLLCGKFVCSQSFCCSENERGECNIHAKT